MGYAPQNVRVIIPAMLPYEGLAGPGSTSYIPKTGHSS